MTSFPRVKARTPKIPQGLERLQETPAAFEAGITLASPALRGPYPQSLLVYQSGTSGGLSSGRFLRHLLRFLPSHRTVLKAHLDAQRGTLLQAWTTSQGR